MERLKEFYYINKKIIIISGIAILIFIISCICIYFYNIFDKNNEVIVNTIQKEEKQVKKEDEESIKQTKFIVDIKGKVKEPGIYIMDENDRVHDVIKKAGGLLSDSDTSSINLSKKVYDEMVIIVHSKEEIDKFVNTKDKETIINDKCNNNIIIKNDACIVDNTLNFGDDEIQKISINTASKEELMKLPNIGEAKAISIIKYREENNGFKSIEEITNVFGIGESLFEKIKDYITI